MDLKDLIEDFFFNSNYTTPVLWAILSATKPHKCFFPNTAETLPFILPNPLESRSLLIYKHVQSPLTHFSASGLHCFGARWIVFAPVLALSQPSSLSTPGLNFTPFYLWLFIPATEGVPKTHVTATHIRCNLAHHCFLSFQSLASWSLSSLLSHSLGSRYSSTLKFWIANQFSWIICAESQESMVTLSSGSFNTPTVLPGLWASHKPTSLYSCLLFF